MRPIRRLIAGFKSVEDALKKMSIQQGCDDDYVSDQMVGCLKYEDILQRASKFGSHWDYYKEHYENDKEFFLNPYGRFQEVSDMEIIVWFGSDHDRVKKKDYKLHISYYYSRALELRDIAKKRSSVRTELITQTEFRVSTEILISLYEIFIEGLKLEEESDELENELKKLRLVVKRLKGDVTTGNPSQQGEYNGLVGQIFGMFKSYTDMSPDEQEDYLGNKFTQFMGEQGYETGANVSRMLGGLLNNVNIDDLQNGNMEGLAEQANNILNNENVTGQISEIVGQMTNNTPSEDGEPQPTVNSDGPQPPQFDINELLNNEGIQNIFNTVTTALQQPNNITTD